MLPVSEAIYDYRTMSRTDTFSTDTAVGVTTANETLLDDLYNGDIGSVDIDSDDATDAPLANSYNVTNQVLNIGGLTANATRILGITYDVGALTLYVAVDTLLDFLPYIWVLIIICFPPAALFAIFTNRA